MNSLINSELKNTPCGETQRTETRLLWKGRAKYIADTGGVIPSECLNKHPTNTNIAFLFGVELNRKRTRSCYEAVGKCTLEVMPNGIDASCVLRDASVVLKHDEDVPLIAKIRYLTNGARINDIALEPIDAGIEIFLTQIRALVCEVTA